MADIDETVLLQRLALQSPALVGELYETTKWLLSEERGKQQRLDAKASRLYILVGFLLIVAIIVRSHTGPQSPLQHFALGFVLISGLSSMACAAMALRVRQHLHVNDETVFSGLLLQTADGMSGDAGVTWYRKNVIPHIMEIVHHTRALHQVKAKWMTVAQRLFVAFALSVLVACFLSV